jgi:type I site-specific restriction endonuclease
LIKKLSERNISSKYITPAVVSAGWDLHTQIREEVSFTKEQKPTDYILIFWYAVLQAAGTDA